MAPTRKTGRTNLQRKKNMQNLPTDVMPSDGEGKVNVV